MHVVIGSGPAGVACAKALLRRGVPVRMLDAGVQLEPERRRIVAEMSTQAPVDWPREQVAVLKENMAASGRGIPLKRVFGSDFPYREAEQHLPADYHGVALRPSLALGGFSNVWGAAMLPYRDEDLDGWPIRSAALAAHYRAVLEFTGLSARRDDLEEHFPLHTDHAVPLELSRQARGLMRRLEGRREQLRAAGVQFGAARLAVRAAGSDGTGCVYCGLCMYGCPYGHIYNSADTVRRMETEKDFSYAPGLIVTGVEEAGGRVRIQGHERGTRQPFVIEAARVYLAAGLIPTTRILLASLAAHDEAVRARDNQYFLFPLLLRQRVPDVRTEALNTLSQIFFEIQNAAVNRHTVHLQVYSYNDLIGQAVRQKFGPLARPLEFLARQLEDRLLVVQGYLHSDDSAALRMTLKRGAGGAPDRLDVAAEPSARTRPAIRRVLKLLQTMAGEIGARPLTPLLQVAEPGRGFHSGGSFPMSAQPGRFASDGLGRPGGLERVHAVDATVFPTIPATTITLSVMANAHRIGWESAWLP